MMNERLVPLVFDFQGQAAGDGVRGAYIPSNRSALLVAVSHYGSVAGAPTSATADVNDGASGIAGATGIDLTSNGITTLSTPHRLDSGDDVNIDINLNGGTSPSFTGAIVLWLLIGE